MTRRFASLTARPLLLLACAATAACLSTPSAAQQPSLTEIETRQSETRREYEDLSREMALTETRRAELEAEMEALKKDFTSLTAALIQSAQSEKKLGADIQAIEERMTGLREQQDGIRISLSSRRAVLAEVLAALQRMGLNPPPAILVRPEDALASVRSAILLGAVVPGLRQETQVLLGDLTELKRVTASIEAERETLRARIGEQVAEREKLKLLLEEKKALQAETLAAAKAEAEKAGELAAKAGSMQELIASLESELTSVRTAQEAARKRAEELERLRAEGRPVPEGHALGPSIPFEALKNKLVLPVSGRIVKRFGEKEASGRPATGDTVLTQSGSIVTAPVDATVLYAGKFRSYGQLLILDAGGGYHIVMAGMERLNVTQGQSLLAGEPVGTMGDKRVAAASSFGTNTSEPELFFEIRKDKKPVEPLAWWAAGEPGRTGNDT